MKQKSIDFRELLERLLPLDQLAPTDRLRVHRALTTGVAEQIEQAGLLALQQLELAGALRRLDQTPNGGPPAVRYQSRDALDVITIELPEPRETSGFLILPRASLPAQAQAGIDQVRRLLGLDVPQPFSDPRRGDARSMLIEQLHQAGRDFLGTTEFRLVVSGESDAAGLEPPLDPRLAEEARRHPDSILYCSDLARAPRVEALVRGRNLHAMALACVSSSEGEPFGTLEVLSHERDPFRPGELSMIALLADYCARALERAARIEKLVFVDPLTSAYNRSYFDLQVQNEMARAQRERTSLALCIADIDDFKSFNTTFGYEAGNQVLVQVAQSLKSGVRPFDTVARWGGEEFAVLLTAPVAAEDVTTVCERLRALVERMPVGIEGLDRRAHRIGVTVSLGVAMFPDHAENAQDLWRAANQALLQAKRPPKNQVVFFRPEGGAPRLQVH